MIEFIKATETTSAMFINNVRKTTYVMRLTELGMPLSMDMPVLTEGVSANTISVDTTVTAPVTPADKKLIGQKAETDNTITFVDCPTFVRDPIHYLTKYTLCYNADGYSIAYGCYKDTPLMVVSTPSAIYISKGGEELIEDLDVLDLPDRTGISVNLISSNVTIKKIVLYTMSKICKAAKASRGIVRPTTFKKVAILARLLPDYVSEDATSATITIDTRRFIAVAGAPRFVSESREDNIERFDNVDIIDLLTGLDDVKPEVTSDRYEFEEEKRGHYHKRSDGLFELPFSAPVALDLTDFSIKIDGHTHLIVGLEQEDYHATGFSRNNLASTICDVNPELIRNIRYIIIDGTDVQMLFKLRDVVKVLKRQISESRHNYMLPENVVTLAAVYNEFGEIELQDIITRL